jgi:hypothetical protein
MFSLAAVLAMLVGFGVYVRSFVKMEENFKEDGVWLGMAVLAWAGFLAYIGAVGAGAFARSNFAIYSSWTLFVGGCIAFLVFGLITWKNEEARSVALLATLASAVTGLAGAKIAFAL